MSTSGEARRELIRKGGSLDLSPPGVEGEIRIKAARARDDGVDYQVLVGASLEERNATLASLKTLLLIGGPIALALASLAGYGLASAALRPVERMRRRAAEISASEPRPPLRRGGGTPLGGQPRWTARAARHRSGGGVLREAPGKRL